MDRGLSDLARVVVRTSGIPLALAGLLLALATAALGSEWAVRYPADDHELIGTVSPTLDGGFICGGWTQSYGSGGRDALLIKLTSSGTAEWQRVYGGSGKEGTSRILQTSDGGYFAVGYTDSWGEGFWLLKLSSAGDLTRQRRYTGVVVNAMAPAGPGAFVLAGSTSKYGAGYEDGWIALTDEAGELIWQRSYGGAGYRRHIFAIEGTSDGGYVAAGRVRTGTGDVYEQLWVLKIDATGDVEWQYTYGGNPAYVDNDGGFDIIETSDGAYVAVGYLTSYAPQGYWMIKLDSVGVILWQWGYGGPGLFDRAYGVVELPSGNLVMAGHANSYGAGNLDVWMIGTDGSGAPIWHRTLGGANEEVAYGLCLASDGDLVVPGRSSSYGNSTYDVWILKTTPGGEIGAGCGMEASSAIVAVSALASRYASPNLTSTATSKAAVEAFGAIAAIFIEPDYTCYAPGAFQPERGDLNSDGRVDLLDVRICYQIAEGFVSPTAHQSIQGDVDADEDIDLEDARILAEYVAGLRTTLP
ncbi:dockerin type I repeat-containing protein [Candidatus Bipolaricaulota bacterium]